MSEFLPVKETPEQIQWNIKAHRELVSSVVRSHVTEMAQSIEDLKTSSAQHLKQLKAEHERIDQLQIAFHYLLRVLDTEHLV